MNRLLGSRGASAVMGFFMLALASSEAPRADRHAIRAGVRRRGGQVGRRRHDGQAAAPLCVATTTPSQPRSLTLPAVLPMQQAVADRHRHRHPGAARRSRCPGRWRRPIAREAAWLYHAGWPLYALVDRYSAGAPLDEEANCLATAVYFEARGEAARGPAGGRRRGHEPRRLGQVSAELVLDRQAAGAILVRPQRPVPGRRRRVRRRGAGRRPSPGWRSATPCRACRATCCGITPIMSRRRGAGG